MPEIFQDTCQLLRLQTHGQQDQQGAEVDKNGRGHFKSHRNLHHGRDDGRNRQGRDTHWRV